VMVAMQESPVWFQATEQQPCQFVQAGSTLKSRGFAASVSGPYHGEGEPSVTQVATATAAAMMM
jgi:hypothetical protein